MTRGPDEGTRVALLFQDLSQVALLLLQVLCTGDTPSPVEQTPDQPSLDMWWVMGPEVKVVVCVCGLLVDGDVKGAITFPPEQNGYPGALIQSSRHPPQQEGPQESPSKEGDRPPLVVLPYTAGVSENIRRVCRRFGIKVVFRSSHSLRSMLTKVKDALPMEKQANVVYRIPCSCGKAYIGETKRRLETRLREHQDACRTQSLQKSAVAEHAWEATTTSTGKTHR